MVSKLRLCIRKLLVMSVGFSCHLICHPAYNRQCHNQEEPCFCVVCQYDKQCLLYTLSFRHCLHHHSGQKNHTGQWYWIFYGVLFLQRKNNHPYRITILIEFVWVTLITFPLIVLSVLSILSQKDRWESNRHHISCIILHVQVRPVPFDQSFRRQESLGEWCQKWLSGRTFHMLEFRG